MQRVSSVIALFGFCVSLLCLISVGVAFVFNCWGPQFDRVATVGFIALIITFVIVLAQADEITANNKAANNETAEDTERAESDS